jgi:hypothetical protein
MVMSDDKPPVIVTEHGPVTEVARKQAALNIARDPLLKARLISQFGEAILRRQYPEAFDDND